MDDLTGIGLTAAAAIVGGAAGALGAAAVLFTLVGWDVELRGPWLKVALVITLAQPFVAAAAAAAFVGLSSDLGTAVRAIVAVVAGVAVYSLVFIVGMPKPPVEPYDVVEGDTRRWGCGVPATWRPTAGFTARFIIVCCVLAPGAGGALAFAIATR